MSVSAHLYFCDNKHDTVPEELIDFDGLKIKYEYVNVITSLLEEFFITMKNVYEVVQLELCSMGI